MNPLLDFMNINFIGRATNAEAIFGELSGQLKVPRLCRANRVYEYLRIT